MAERGVPAKEVAGHIALPTDNDLGIPVLRLDRQCDHVDLPFARWGRERRKSRMRGTWHFYTDDSRFSRLWQRPQDLINSGCVSAVEPNWSVTPETTAAEAIWQTYRKRYLARLWQDAGVRMLVDLNVAASSANTNLLGVPKGWRAYASRWSMHHDMSADYETACERCGSTDIVFVLYGGGRSAQEWAQLHGAVWFPEEADMVRGRCG